MIRITQTKISLFLFSSITFLLFGCLETGSSDKQVKSLKVDYEIEAQVILDAYDANEIAADAKFKNKVLIVEGIVAKIESSGFLSGPTVILENEYVGLECELAETSTRKAASLEKGMKVRIRGELAYKNTMHHCVFE